MKEKNKIEKPISYFYLSSKMEWQEVERYLFLLPWSYKLCCQGEEREMVGQSFCFMVQCQNALWRITHHASQPPSTTPGTT
jgi:hypothetical protein